MGLLWLHGSHISSNMEDLWHVIQQKKDCTYNLQLGQKIFLDVPFDSQSLLSALLPSHSGQQTAKRVPSCCRRCWLECRSQSGASSEVQWIIMKSFTLAQNQTGILFIETHVGTPSHWLISSEYDLVNATHMLPPLPTNPSHALFSIPQNP